MNEGKKIKDTRILLGISRTALAKRSGIDPKRLLRIEDGAIVRLDELNKIAPILGLKIKDFID